MDKWDETIAKPPGKDKPIDVDNSRFRRAGSAEGGAADARLPRDAATFLF